MTTRVLGAMLFLLVALGGGVSLADEPPSHDAPPPEKPSSFGAPASDWPLPVVAPGDFEGLLRNCDVERSRADNAKKMCEKDAANMPFLVSAYLALWAILMVFFTIVALRQQRLRAEMSVLRERLARLGDDDAPKAQPDVGMPPKAQPDVGVP